MGRRASRALAFLLLVSALAHIVTPESYALLIPEFLPLLLSNWIAAGAELVVGIALLVGRWRIFGGLSFSLLMLGFLPLHVWDLLRPEPFLGSTWAAALRLLFQLFLIFLGWKIAQDSREESKAAGVAQ